MDEIRSGGDIEWSERATGMGFNLGYAADAIVDYPAKQYDAFIKKAVRIGRGRKSMRAIKNSHSGIAWLFHSLVISRPPSPFSLSRRLKGDGHNLSSIQFIKVWWMTWVYRLVRGKEMLK
jgi:GT2 family glycosyltransferase